MEGDGQEHISSSNTTTTFLIQEDLKRIQQKRIQGPDPQMRSQQQQQVLKKTQLPSYLQTGGVWHEENQTKKLKEDPMFVPATKWSFSQD